MGKANRQRRRMKEKERKQHRRASAPGAAFQAGPTGMPGDWTTVWPQPNLDELAAEAIAEAVNLLDQGDQASFTQMIEIFAERSENTSWCQTTERLLGSMLNSMISRIWRLGWQPADVVRIISRNLSSQHVRLIRDVIAADLDTYAPTTIDPRWTAQLAELSIQVWWRSDQTYLRAWATKTDKSATPAEKSARWVSMVSCALETVHMLDTLPTLEKLGPIPGTAHPAESTAAYQQRKAVDSRILSRVRALLAKAESTNFPAEAETFTAGAQALMARHSIDLALLAAADQTASDQPTGRRIGIDNPYEGPKAMLLGVVSQANRCRTVWSQQLGFSTVMGFPADLDAVELLFTSLLLQATTAIRLAGSRVDARGQSRTRSFRQSFLTAYAARIGERLTETISKQTAEAAAEPSGENLLPVLAAREQQVDEAVTAMFPKVTPHQIGAVTNSEGWYSGRSAADNANLTTGEALPG